ncbi:hypothetical protein B0J17DRAFT_454382 [Rhizoctonia solani]|nr:hypothetical protein B0J17DRAFT_454382 [Rhizoctonia solani]
MRSWSTLTILMTSANKNDATTPSMAMQHDCIRPPGHSDQVIMLRQRHNLPRGVLSRLHLLAISSLTRSQNILMYPYTLLSGASILPNNTRTTATLRVTFKPAYVYSRDRKAFQDIDRATREPIRHEEWCTFIQDYREGNVFDVVGSIGGLFALLQAAHVLLFGRPMLWGLTGAKLLTPFGILGACSSRNFRRRLREQYHREPTEDNPETLRIGAFLRDFIIELGPAEGEYNPPAGTSSGILGSPTRPIDIGKNSADSQVPLLSLGLRESPSLEKSDGASGVQDSVMHLKDDV